MVMMMMLMIMMRMIDDEDDDDDGTVLLIITGGRRSLQVIRQDQGTKGIEGFGEAVPIRLGGLGSVVSSPSGVRGGAPAENGFGAF